MRKVKKIPPKMRKELKGKSSLYRNVSIAGGIIFILLAMFLPVYMDYLRRPAVVIPASYQAEDEPIVTGGENRFSVKREVDRRVLEGIRREAEQKPVNNVCSIWVFGRCDALGIPQEVCSGFMEEALKVPVESGLAGCREAFEEKLAEASRKTLESLTEEKITEEKIPVPIDEPSLSASNAQDVTEAQKDEQSAEQRPEKKEMTPEEKKSALEKLYTLVEETQIASWNYGTLKSEQERRLNEMKEIVEKLDDSRFRKLYESVSSQASRFSGYSPPPVQLEAAEAGVITVQSVPVGEADLDKRSAVPPTDELKLIKKEIDRLE